MELVKKRVRQYAMFFEKQIWTEEAMEVIVPDIFPDVERIIGGSAELKIKEKVIVEGKIKVQCEIFARTFCQAGENSDVFVIESQGPFSYIWDAEDCENQDFLTLTGTVMQMQPVMLNPRKLSGKVQLSFVPRVYQRQEFEYTEGARCEQTEKMNMLTEKTSQTLIVATAEKRISINEEIRITGTNISPTDRLFHCDAEWVTEDIRVMTNKVILRGNCRLKAVIMAEKAAFVTQNTYTMPFSQIIEIDNTDVNDIAQVDFQTMSCMAKIVARQDGTVFLCCEIGGNASVLIRRTREIEMLTDLYSTAFDTNCEMVEVMAPSQCRVINVEALANDVLELEQKAVRVHDYRLCSRCEGINHSEETISGTVCIEVMYETASGQICCQWKKITVEAPIDGEIPQNATHDMCVENPVISCDAEGNICVAFKAVWTIEFMQNKRVQCVKVCGINLNAPKCCTNRASLILRCIDHSDSIWGIAKKYNTTMFEIMAANKMTAQSELTPGRLIMIPFGQ